MAKRKKKVKKVYNPIRKKARGKNRAVKKLQRAFQRSEIKTAKKEYTIESLNRTLNYIQSNSSINRDNKLGSTVAIIARKLEGLAPGEILKPGHYEYFEIDDKWDGSTASLINHIKFKKDNSSVNVDLFIKNVVESKWGDAERHSEYLQTSRDAAFAKNILDVDVSESHIDTLRNIMNSSEMWEIVADKYGLGTKTYDSESAKRDWDDMAINVDKMFKIRKLSQSDVDKFKTSLMNYDSNLSNVVEEILKKYT